MKVIFLDVDGVLNSRDCLVKTSFYGEYGGLQKEHVEKAIRLLNK